MNQNRIKDELLQTGTSVQAHISKQTFWGVSVYCNQKQYSMYIYVHCESALKKSMLGIRQRRIYLISLLNLFHSSGTILFYYAYGIM